MKFRKYEVNKQYFKQLNSNSAYLLGYIFADGVVSKRTLQFSCSPNDKEILEFLVSQICPTAKIIEKNRLHKANGKIYKSLFLRIHSIDLVKDINKWNIDNIPKELLPDFYRGLFDGDGCFGIYNRGNNYNLVFDYVTSDSHFTNRVKEYFNVGYTRDYGTYFRFRSNGLKDIISIGDKIYNGNFCLQRKFKKFVQIKECKNAPTVKS